jgi:hypothetical protein
MWSLPLTLDILINFRIAFPLGKTKTVYTSSSDKLDILDPSRITILSFLLQNKLIGTALGGIALVSIDKTENRFNSNSSMLA